MHDRGKEAEAGACRFLESKGFTILERNYFSRYGEIDIIAQGEEFLIFAEVKARGEKTLAQPKESVTRSKQQKIIRTAKMYLAGHPVAAQPRFDVIEVFFPKTEGEPFRVKLLKNAFWENTAQGKY